MNATTVPCYDRTNPALVRAVLQNQNIFLLKIFWTQTGLALKAFLVVLLSYNVCFEIQALAGSTLDPYFM